jgi:hypothetical protein
MTERFKVEFLAEAAEFMEGLDGKARAHKEDRQNSFD